MGSSGGVLSSFPLVWCQAIQTVGNMDAAASRAKEGWMAPLQPTIQQSISQMKEFITKLIDIEEKEGEWICWSQLV